MRAKPTTLAMLAWIVVAAVLAMMCVGPGAAASVVVTEHVRAELVPETAAIPTDGGLWVSLRFDIKPGWHTYWRNPGDSGEATRITWRLPAGVEAGEIQWPAPKRIPYGPLVNFGYEGRVDHLVRLTLPAGWPAGAPLEVEADASWLVCEDICIPESGRFTLRWAPQAAAVAAEPDRVAAFERLRGALPAPAPWPVVVRIDGDHLVLDVATPELAGVTDAAFFPYEWDVVEPAGRQELRRRADGGIALALPRGERTADLVGGVLVVNQPAAAGPTERAYAITAVVEADRAGGGGGIVTGAGGGGGIVTGAAGGGGSGEGGMAGGLARALLLALLGGLILNLMPCVFPVLSIKAFGLIQHADAAPPQRRLGGVLYTAGVLAFMAVVAGVLLALKAAGVQVGWGYQLQSPAFVSLMAVVLFLLGLSLAGWFSFGASMMGWGSGLAGRADGVGAFFTGALAALVATPCTAPFMGVAIGFALTQPWSSAVAVMLTLGLGLALPYLVLSWLPGAAHWLPRPGPWMDRLKQFLAFPLFASAAWLIWVLAVQVGPSGVLAALLALVAAALAVWLGRIAADSRGGWRLAGRAAAFAFAAAATVLALTPEVVRPEPAAARPVVDVGLHAQPFSAERLAALRSAGTPVFVNMTAAWCITCKVNERVALSSQRIAGAFAGRGVVYLKGDWTSRDPEITRFLEGFGRSGVPLYVLYPGDGRPPVVLPQLLTEAIVLDAIGEPAALGTTPSTTERTS